MILEPGSKLLFIGDSVTDCGRSQPIGEGLGDALGRGYVSLVDSLLGAAHPELGIRVVNVGTSGQTVRDLQARWKRDVLDLRPDWLSVMIGINDVWHGENDPARGTSVEKFEEGMKDIIARIQKAGAKVIVCTPSVIGEKTGGANELDKRLDTYSDLSRKVAKETHSRLCDLRLVFADYLKDHNDKNKEAGILTGDRVHLNDAGNKLVAESILKVLDPAE